MSKPSGQASRPDQPDSAQILSTSTANACVVRLGRVGKALTEQNLDALLVVSEHDILYLTGFVGHDSLLVVSRDGGATILSDPRYDEYLDPWRHAGIAEIVMGKRHRLEQALATLCGSKHVKRLGIQAEHVTLARLQKLRAALGGIELTETIGLINRLRMRKDEVEIAAIRRAAAVQQDALTAALKQLREGMTELQLSALLEFEMKSRGAHGSAFTPIIGAGANSSIIHHSTGGAPIREGVLLIDWGAMVDGYNADMTRTYGVGSMPERIREIYSIVLEAQLAAIDAIAPGRICAQIDAVARKIITDAGYGEQFGHGLGHGLGIDVHEEPYFNDLATDIALEPGMVMTVEPGIYLPGVGGVRIEDDVLITDDGCRLLCNYPKDLDSAVIEPHATANFAAARAR